MKCKRWRGREIIALCILGGICAGSIGCMRGRSYVEKNPPVPRELRLTTLPTYVIEPPDLLLITVMSAIPKPPYKIKPLDVLFVQATNLLPDRPLGGPVTVEPDGKVTLGLDYGTVRVAGMTIPEAQNAIVEHLSLKFKKPQVLVSLYQTRGVQQISGEHLVRMDGTISLGTYGSAYITGMTLDQARKAIEQHLSEFLLDPEISIDVYSYNSKWYYVVMDRAGNGQSIIRLPITGRDTVLDALSQVQGTSFLSSDHRIWVARPNGDDPYCAQVLPVAWRDLTKCGSPATNFQLMPGDRLFVRANPLYTINNRMTQVFAPLQSVMGMALFGSSAVSTIAGTVQQLQTGTTGFGLAGSGVGPTFVR